MQIELIAQPEAAQIHPVRELERLCQQSDELKGSLFLDPSLNFSPDVPCLLTLHEGDTLAGAMTFFAPTQEEAEIVGLTHPAYRRRGVFRALLAAAAQRAQLLQIPTFYWSASRNPRMEWLRWHLFRSNWIIPSMRCDTTPRKRMHG